MNTKISKLFAGALLVGLWACSSEEPAGISAGGDQKAYLAVDLRDANSNTRSDSDFADGEGYENSISSSLFIFFDASGHYMCTGEIKSGDWTDPGTDDEQGSVEKIGRNIIILSGLNGIDYPRYMMTVLNDPAGLRQDIEANRYTMAQTQTLVTNYNPSAQGNFMMTTSSHGGKDSMVTDLSSYSLYSEMPSATEIAEDQWVKVYVERLAASVEMSIGDNRFILPGDFHLGSLDENGKMQYSTKQLAVKIEGWGLNSTARDSYLSKDIAGLSNPLGDWTWDNSAFHRSYWGKSTCYGEELASDYTYQGDEGISTPYAEDIHTLKYYNWAQMSKQFKGAGVPVSDSRAYCLENTNTVDKISHGNKLLAKNVTCAIVKATVVDASNDKPVDAIRYQGILFDRSSFVPYALSLVDGAGRLPYYVVESEVKDEQGNLTKTNYRQLGAENFELRLTGEGTGIVAVFQNVAEGTQVFKRTVDNGIESYVAMTSLDEIDQNLRAVIGTAMAYTDGAMFYVVPIRHLRDVQSGSVLEGNYGIVRNHLYQITVNNIKTLGHGVFEPGTGSSTTGSPDPGEPIIPDDPDPEFYVSARIRILAWRVVNQTIDF